MMQYGGEQQRNLEVRAWTGLDGGAITVLTSLLWRGGSDWPVGWSVWLGAWGSGEESGMRCDLEQLALVNRRCLVSSCEVAKSHQPLVQSFSDLASDTRSATGQKKQGAPNECSPEKDDNGQDPLGTCMVVAKSSMAIERVGER